MTSNSDYQPSIFEDSLQAINSLSRQRFDELNRQHNNAYTRMKDLDRELDKALKRLP